MHQMTNLLKESLQMTGEMGLCNKDCIALFVVVRFFEAARVAARQCLGFKIDCA
jgi:hypothetical protein